VAANSFGCDLPRYGSAKRFAFLGLACPAAERARSNAGCLTTERQEAHHGCPDALAFDQAFLKPVAPTASLHRTTQNETEVQATGHPPGLVMRIMCFPRKHDTS